MKAVVLGPSFGLEHLALADVPEPVPGPGELLVRVRAASLNYRDLMVISGEYNPRYRLPLVIGSDAAGEVVALGPGAEVHGFALGDRVCPSMAQGWLDGPPLRETVRHTLGGPLQGVLCEYVAVRADSALRIPSYLADVEAACLPCAAVTAWSALHVHSELRAGQSVLTLGSGGVSLFGVQLARLAGARVLATTRKADKRERLFALGVEAVLDAALPDWGVAARELAGGEGVDHVLDVGGAGTLAETLRAVRPGGTISLIGVLGGGSAPSLIPAVMRQIRLQGVLVGHRASFAALLAALEAAQLRPVIDSTYALGDVRHALERLASGQHFGKVCVRVD